MDKTELEKHLALACVTLGCKNYASNGYIYCNDCLHSPATELPKEVWKEKVKREAVEREFPPKIIQDPLSPNYPKIPRSDRNRD